MTQDRKDLQDPLVRKEIRVRKVRRDLPAGRANLVLKARLGREARRETLSHKVLPDHQDRNPILKQQ